MKNNFSNTTNFKNIKEEIKALIAKIKKANYEYYILDQSSISDNEYDACIAELKLIEKKYPELITKNSPTQNVGSDLAKSHFSKKAHDEKMYSLDNAFNFEDLDAFDKRIKKLINKEDDLGYLAEIKIDGLSLNLKYHQEKLLSATTRGDGVIGEDVISNIVNNFTIPKSINIFEDIEVRGEIVLLKKDFQEYKNKIIALNENIIIFNKNSNADLQIKPVPANSRNASSGLLRYTSKQANLNNKNIFNNQLHQIKQNYLQKLIFFAYQIPAALKIGIQTQKQVLQKLSENQFSINKNNFLFKTLFDLKKWLNDYEPKINGLAFEADGIVIKINDLDLQKLLGYTNKFPRWAIAYKYKTLEAQTELLDIFITIGRTGKVTYNAKIAPVSLYGTNINFVTLHNYEYVKNLKLHIGCIVTVIKSGGIIPKIINKVSDNNKIYKPFPKFTNCSSCNSLLLQDDGVVDDFCTNINCPSILKYSLVQFIHKNAMDITNLGENIIEKMVSNNLITSIQDLYTLAENSPQALKMRENFLQIINEQDTKKQEDSKTLQKIILSIKKSKNNSLERLLLGLNIRHLGIKNCEVVAKKFKNMDALMKANADDFNNISGIGSTLSLSLYNFFQLPKNQELINYLKSQNVNMQYLKVEVYDKNSIFYNKNFLITGSFDVSRDILKKQIESKGGNYLSSVSKKLDFLIVGEKPGSKLNKAKELNIHIISANEISNYLIISDASTSK